MAKKFLWWPTDATPEPYEDFDRGGYWWWPEAPGQATPWGNRGYVYIRKILFDEEGKPSLILKRIVRNINIYFDFDKYDLRDDAVKILDEAVKLMRRDSSLSFLLTGHTDKRGDEKYNLRLGENRALAARDFLVGQRIPVGQIQILSRGELDAVAPVTDIVSLQRDRKVHFVVAEVEQIQMPDSEEGYSGPGMVEETSLMEGEIRVGIKKYVVQQNDSLWKIAKREYGDGNQWRRLYEFNRKRIRDPQNLRPGQEIEIPIE